MPDGNGQSENAMILMNLIKITESIESTTKTDIHQTKREQNIETRNKKQGRENIRIMKKNDIHSKKVG